MEKRFQVFVSSTFLDLKEERLAVQKAILELGHFPAGMELFPATDDSAWEIIKDVIDESDYYVLIVGGKYGSLHPEKELGFTEMEYDYAFSKKKPVIALLHKNPGAIPRDKTDKDDIQWKRLEKFREKVQPRHTCQFWEGAHELKANAIVSLTSTIKRHPAVGWLRADSVPTGARVEDVLILKEKITELESQLGSSGSQQPDGAQDLSQGSDEQEFFFAVENDGFEWPSYQIFFTWDEIFSHVGPALYGEISDPKLRLALINFMKNEVENIFELDGDVTKAQRIGKVRVSVQNTDVDTCIVQLRALGLIAESTKKRSVTDGSKYWALTRYGDNKLNQLRAIRKAHTKPVVVDRSLSADLGAKDSALSD